ncbi:MAG: hypothetical protein ACLQFW_15645 [Xanthobacteraceae bacterium]
MTRALAKKLKIAGFPIGTYRVGHKFYPPEQGGEWNETARRHGVTITSHDLQEHMQDMRDGYYCPDVSDLIEACGDRFARLWVSTAIWTAESDDPPHAVLGESPEEALAKLWLALNKRECPPPGGAASEHELAKPGTTGKADSK